MKTTEKSELLSYAEIIDAFRVIPRLILFLYGVFVYQIADWFMALPDPSGAQSTFVSVIVGAASIIVGVYNKSGRKWGDKDE